MNDTSPVPEEAHDDGEEYIVVGAGIDFTDPNSPLAPYYLRVSHLLAAVFLALFFAVFTLIIPIWHTDVWAHLRFGEEIVRQRGLPEHEPFPQSYADHDAPYVHYQWLAQAGAYLVFDLGRSLAAPDADHRLGGGALALCTTHAAILVLRLIVLFVAFRRLTESPAFALLGMVLVAVMGVFVHLFIIRPQIIGELGFACVLLALARPLLSKRALVAVPLVFLVWANCHGSFPMGFVLLGAALAGRMLEAAADKAGGMLAALRTPFAALRAALADAQARRLAAVLALSVLAACANPHGPRLLYESWALSKNPNIPFMEEWKPIPIRSTVDFTFVASVALLALLLRLSPARFTPTQVILLLGFGLQSVAHARVVVWWVMVFAWVALPHLAAVGRRSLPAWVADTSVPSFRKTLLAAGFAVALSLWSGPALWWVHGVEPVGEKRVTPVTPLRAVELIRKHYADEPRRRGMVVFASETLGDYLLWDLQDLEPAVRIPCYTHVHLFPEEHWKKCVAVKSGERGWQEQLRKWDVDLLVLEYDLYEQQKHVEEGAKPGYSNLIDQVRAARDQWTVLETKPVFVAERLRRP